MDSTRVITSKRSTCLPSQKTAHCYDRCMNTGPMYTMCSGNGGNGAQILMNTHSVATATRLQFLPPVRTKSTLCTDSGILHTTTGTSMVSHTFCRDIDTLNATKMLSAVINSTTKPTAFTITTGNFSHNGSNSTTTLEMLTDKKALFIESDNGFFKTQHHSATNVAAAAAATTTTTTDGNKLVNSIKSFFSYLIKPIIDTTSLIVGNDNKTTVNPTDKLNHKTLKFNTDCLGFSDKTNIYTMPDMDNNVPFFDCDDFIDGGEDTVDFVADSTKWSAIDANDVLIDKVIARSLSKDNIFYDCINQFSMDSSPIKMKSIDDYDKSMIIDESIIQPTNDNNIDETNIYADNVSEQLSLSSSSSPPSPQIPNPIQSTKLEAELPKRHSYRRKHKNKRNKNHKSNNRRDYRHKGMSLSKNRQEKTRHDIEMNIHDDVEEIFNDGNHLSNTYECDVDDDDDIDDDIDLEFIDVDESNSIPIIDINKSNTVTDNLSPEEIPTGCIFTKFFRFDNGRNCHLRSLPMRLAKKLLPQSKSTIIERMPIVSRTSETESDDSFIVFEDQSPNTSCNDDVLINPNALKANYSRQRQLSECSDDFICFKEDDTDSEHSYDETTDEDFTDSTDDSDDDESDDCDTDSDDESDCSELFEKKQRDDCNQPDSGFEEKKVSFNLCPKVHEIRAWKFAYSAARKGEWEQIYRDRKRFENRINDLSRVIAPVLLPEHRKKIFKERFMEQQ